MGASSPTWISFFHPIRPPPPPPPALFFSSSASGRQSVQIGVYCLYNWSLGVLLRHNGLGHPLLLTPPPHPHPSPPQPLLLTKCECWHFSSNGPSSQLFEPDSVIHLIQPDSLELRGHLAMFQSTTLQGQPGIAQELDFISHFSNLQLS